MMIFFYTNAFIFYVKADMGLHFLCTNAYYRYVPRFSKLNGIVYEVLEKKTGFNAVGLQLWQILNGDLHLAFLNDAI